jgi:hypothetical protein
MNNDTHFICGFLVKEELSNHFTSNRNLCKGVFAMALDDWLFVGNKQNLPAPSILPTMHRESNDDTHFRDTISAMHHLATVHKTSLVSFYCDSTLMSQCSSNSH